MTTTKETTEMITTAKSTTGTLHRIGYARTLWCAKAGVGRPARVTHVKQVPAATATDGAAKICRKCFR